MKRKNEVVLTLAVDTEYQTERWGETTPISVQLGSPIRQPQFFLHPNTPLSQKERKHDTFASPFAPLDYFGYDWEYTDKDTTLCGTVRLETYFFFSMKDLEFLFADKSVFKEHVLPYLERKRRITSTKELKLPYGVYLGKDLYGVSLIPKDISAMVGRKSLAEYATLAKVAMGSKDTYTKQEKGHMLQQYKNDPERFEAYAMGDIVLFEIFKGINCGLNDVAKFLELQQKEPEDVRGLSMGKIVALFLSEWMAKKLNYKQDNLYKLTGLAGTSGITHYSKITQDKNLVYLSMVDGGRAVKEATKSVMCGALHDIDISGCYGNGLVNQDFAVGNPKVFGETISLSEFMKPKIQRQLSPGLWYARISWHNAPFEQDILLSKTEESFSCWENAISKEGEDGEGEDGEKVYDASMVMATKSVHQAALTHDLLQALQKATNRTEWTWLLKNAKIVTYMAYYKKDEKSEITKAMVNKAPKAKPGANGAMVVGSHDWVRVPLKDFIAPLLKERGRLKKEFGKKSPEEVMYKLIINATYGVIASSFFSEIGTGISNVIVGNNITARARALAWYMSKGLGLAMTVTDGGVGDINEAYNYIHKRTSLNNYFLIRQGMTYTGNYDYFAKKVRLMGEYWDESYLLNKQAKDDVAARAWQHLKEQFTGVDIFDQDQFSFEIKDFYSELVLHSKVDYRLKHLGDEDKYTYSLRGLDKKNDINGQSPDAVKFTLFEAVKANEPVVYRWETDAMYSPSDYKTGKYKDKWREGHELMPHDNITLARSFLSLSPHGRTYDSVSQFKSFKKEYDLARKEGAEAVGRLYLEHTNKK